MTTALDMLQDHYRRGDDSLAALIVGITWAYTLDGSKTVVTGPGPGLQRARDILRPMLRDVCLLNLRLHLGLNQAQAQNQFNAFRKLLHSLEPWFLDRETYYGREDSLAGDVGDLLLAVAEFEHVLSKPVTEKLADRSTWSKQQIQVLDFTLGYLPLAVRDAEQKHLKVGERLWIWSDHTGGVPRSMDVFRLSLDLWNRDFERATGAVLDNSHYQVATEWESGEEREVSLSLWGIGQALGGLGLGFWSPHVSVKGNPSLYFNVPRFLGDLLAEYGHEHDVDPELLNRIKGLLDTPFDDKWGAESFGR